MFNFLCRLCVAIMSFQFAISSQVSIEWQMLAVIGKKIFLLYDKAIPQSTHFISYLEHRVAYRELLPLKYLCITVIISSLRKE